MSNTVASFLRSLKKAQLKVLCEDFGLPTNKNAPELRVDIFDFLKAHPGHSLPGFVSQNGEDVVVVSDNLGSSEDLEPAVSETSPQPGTSPRQGTSSQSKAGTNPQKRPSSAPADPASSAAYHSVSPTIYLSTATTTVTLHQNVQPVTTCSFRPICPVPVKQNPPITNLTNQTQIPLQPVSLTDLTQAVANMLQLQNNNDGSSTGVARSHGESSKNVLAFLRETNRRGLKFTGASHEDVEEFLTKFESVSKFFVLSDADMLLVLKEVIQGDALRYFKTHQQECNSWPSAQSAFKVVFRRYVDPIKLQTDVLQRTQLPNEKIDRYISVLKTLNNRLPVPIADDQLLPIVKHHLHPDYADMIKGQFIPSLDILAYICRGEEERRSQLSSYAPPPIHLLKDPELGNADRAHHEQESSPAAQRASNPWKPRIFRAEAMDKNDSVTPPKEDPPQSPVAKRRNLHCWNCREVGHSYFVCRKTPNVFCYNCGRPEVFTRDCGCGAKRFSRDGHRVFPKKNQEN